MKALGPDPLLRAHGRVSKRDSAGLVPAPLQGLLGLDEAQLRGSVRLPSVTLAPTARSTTSSVRGLGSRGQAVYVFARSSHRLTRVQLAQQHRDLEVLSGRAFSSSRATTGLSAACGTARP